MDLPSQRRGDGELCVGLGVAVAETTEGVDKVGTALEDFEVNGGGRGLRTESCFVLECLRFLSDGVDE